jgi:hypothetical protein
MIHMIQELSGQTLRAGKTTLDMFKNILTLLPKSEKSEQAGQQIEEAERAPQSSKAELAKGLGYRICRCTFLPQIMLWKEKERASICALCGNRYPPKVEVGKLTTGFRSIR